MIQVKFNDKAKQVLADTLDLSGSVVVTELPQVGEEHTIYELQETKVADFPWLLTEMDSSKNYVTPGLPLLVVENEEDVTYENLKMRSIKPDVKVGVYVKATNKVYQCWWEEGEIGEPGDPDYTFIKEEVIPAHDILYTIEKTKFVILRDFDYHSSDDKESVILDGTGHLLDGTDFEYNFVHGVPLVLTDATNKKIGLDNERLIGIEDGTEEELPPFVTQVNKIDLSLVVSEGLYAFIPQPSKQVSTYWIYTNGEWVNVDDIKSTLHKTVYGTLTDVDGSLTLACSITYDEIVNNFKNGDITILEYKPTDGDGYYYCAITDAQWGEADNPSLQLKTWSLLYGWLQYSPSQGFSFNNGAL